MLTAVLERGGNICATVDPNRHRKAIQDHVRKNVKAGSNLYADELQSYEGLGNSGEYVHQVINHAECYVDGQTHTDSVKISGVC